MPLTDLLQLFWVASPAEPMLLWRPLGWGKREKEDCAVCGAGIQRPRFWTQRSMSGTASVPAPWMSLDPRHQKGL